MTEQTEDTGLPKLPKELPAPGIIVLRHFPIWTVQRWPDDATYAPMGKFHRNMRYAYGDRHLALIPEPYLDRPGKPFAGQAKQWKKIIGLAQDQTVLVTLDARERSRCLEIEKHVIDGMGKTGISISVVEPITLTKALVSRDGPLGKTDPINLADCRGAVTIMEHEVNWTLD